MIYSGYNTIYDLRSHFLNQSDSVSALDGVLIDNTYVSELFAVDTQIPLRLADEVGTVRTHGILFQNLDKDLLHCFQIEAKRKEFDTNVVREYLEVSRKV